MIHTDDMYRLLKLIQDGDLLVPVERCGALLRLARSKRLIANDPTKRRRIVITAIGKAWMLEHTPT